MADWIEYLLKVNLSIALFYGGYYFFLRKLTFYLLNRYYLIGSMLFSFLHPLVDFPLTFTREKNLQHTDIQSITWNDLVAKVPPNDDIWKMATIVFLSVVITLFLRFFIRLLSLWKIHRGSTATSYANYRYRQVWIDINPFSFWKAIYLNPALHKESTLKEILKHESEHVKQLHTIDVLIVEIVTICCWFNPAIWLTRSAVKENLEFLTDQRVLQSGVDKKQYQYSLINLSSQTLSPELSNHFNFNALKKRIIMMNKKKSSQLHLGKYIFIIPAISVSAMAFTVSKAYHKVNIPTNFTLQDSTPNAVNDTQKRQDEFNGVMKAQSTDLRQTAKQVTVSFKSEKQEGPSQKKNPLYIIDGVPLEEQNLGKLNPNDVASIEVFKDSINTARYGDKGKNGVVLIAMKNKKNEHDAATTAATGNHEVGPSTKTVNSSTIKIKNKNTEEKGKQAIPENVTYIIDGQLSDKETFELLKSTDIESIDVIKDPENETGTINITTKKNK